MKNKILIAEISGKRPGDKFNRPTEKFKFDFDKVIISNNSEGYETTWPIVNVPKEYEEWYYLNIRKGTYKKCSKCGEVKLISQFSKNGNRLRGNCKDCK